jgi:mRNA-degrading endonuclease toxin of MazEF toxin-antitoxin module
MSQFAFGEIYLVKFHPASGKEIKKYRPAIIINHLSAIDKRFVMIVPLTSNLNDLKNLEIIIENKNLKYKSKILTWYIRTVDINRLEERIGQLSKSDEIMLRKNLLKLFTG